MDARAVLRSTFRVVPAIADEDGTLQIPLPMIPRGESRWGTLSMYEAI